MHELIYYSIFAIILYFVLTQVFENFNLEQENFDPSLVPVSSIVTLAKVAQKLVNGNGTLTNPGNLQIGASSSAPGNLTVTGGINIPGFNGMVSMPEVNGDAGVVSQKGLTVGSITMGRHAGDAWDYLRAGSPNGLLLSAASKNIYVWGQNNLRCQNELTTNGLTSLNGGLNLNNTGANFLNINKGTAVDANSVRVWRNDPGELHLVGMKADMSDYSWPGIKLDTRNSKVTANTLQADGLSYFGGTGTNGFRWGNEGGNGWSCLRTNKNDNRLCFNQDHGVTHFSAGGGLEIPGKITAPKGISAGGGGIENNIGGLTWMNTVKANTFDATNGITAGGDISTPGAVTAKTGVYINTRDDQNTFTWYSENGNQLRLWSRKTYANGSYLGGGAGNIMEIDSNGSVLLRDGAAFCIGGVCLTKDHLRALRGEKEFMIQARSGHCVDVGNGRYSGCNPGVNEIAQKIRYF